MPRRKTGTKTKAGSTINALKLLVRKKKRQIESETDSSDSSEESEEEVVVKKTRKSRGVEGVVDEPRPLPEAKVAEPKVDQTAELIDMIKKLHADVDGMKAAAAARVAEQEKKLASDKAAASAAAASAAASKKSTRVKRQYNTALLRSGLHYI